MQKSRLEAFSDGVLAIIITIMVLEIKVPKGQDWTDLMPLLPKLLSYVLSFLYVGIYWGNHHHLVHTAGRVTSGIMLANLNLLFWLSLIPFTTGWLGENDFASKPVMLYSINLFLAAIAYFILQKAVEKTTSAHPRLSTALQKHTRKGIISQIAYSLAIAGSFVSPVVSMSLIFFVAILWLIPDQAIEKALQ
ncbi:MAG: hypothetical protein RLY16_886 [Bacteroidota bacterium]|jgi:uncharacterized membrane protein